MRMLFINHVDKMTCTKKLFHLLFMIIMLQLSAIVSGENGVEEVDEPNEKKTAARDDTKETQTIGALLPGGGLIPGFGSGGLPTFRGPHPRTGRWGSGGNNGGGTGPGLGGGGYGDDTPGYGPGFGRGDPGYGGPGYGNGGPGYRNGGPGYGRGGSDYGPGYGRPGNGFEGGDDPGNDGDGFGPGGGGIGSFPGRGIVPP